MKLIIGQAYYTRCGWEMEPNRPPVSRDLFCIVVLGYDPRSKEFKLRGYSYGRAGYVTVDEWEADIGEDGRYDPNAELAGDLIAPWPHGTPTAAHAYIMPPRPPRVGWGRSTVDFMRCDHKPVEGLPARTTWCRCGENEFHWIPEIMAWAPAGAIRGYRSA
jgi:hypothetical protein